MPPRRRAKSEDRQDVDPDARDFVIARLAVARTEARLAIDKIDEAVELFSYPEDDRDGADRVEAVGECLEFLGRANRAAEAAEKRIEAIDPDEGEPWDGGDRDDG